MEDLDKDESIPQQTKGSQTDVNSTISFDTDIEALLNFRTAKNKLLNVSSWHIYSGKGTADFQLTDNSGIAINRFAQKGDFFRINIPGPGSTAGDGYDWVQIQEINEDDKEAEGKNQVLILVKPAKNPTNSDDNTAHFFSEDASSTFMVRREGKELSAEVHGRNELANTNQENLIDKARNILVATGAILGFSEVQWKSLTKGLLDSNIK